MNLLREIWAQLDELCRFSKGTIKFGFYLMIGCYVLGTYARYLSPTSRNYMGIMALSRGFYEAAPACFAAAVCAALICDLIYKKDLTR